MKNIVLFFLTSAVRNSLFDVRYSKSKRVGNPQSEIVEPYVLLAIPHRYILLEGAFAHGGAVTTVPGVSGAAL